LRDLAVKNFRRFDKPCELKLAPISLFTGTNNSGKSTIIKATMLLSDYFDSNMQLSLNFNGAFKDKHKIENYQSACHWINVKDKNLDIDFSFINFDYKIQLQFTEHEDTTNGSLKHFKITRLKDNSAADIVREGKSYQLNIDRNLLEKRADFSGASEDNELLDLLNKTNKEIEKLNEKLKQVESISVQISIKQELIKLEKNKKTISTSLKEVGVTDKKHTYAPKIDLSDLTESNRNIVGILKTALSKYFQEDKSKAAKLHKSSNFSDLDLFIEEISSAIKIKCKHLSAHRNQQTKLFNSEDNVNDINALMNRVAQRPFLKDESADVFLKKWMSKFDIGTDYKIDSVHNVAAIVQVLENNNWAHLVDKGFGAGQIFTILVEIANIIEGKIRITQQGLEESSVILLIEEPEANLHPNFQSLLAELFYEASMNYGIHFIVETHSEYLIRNTQVIGVKNELFKEHNSNPFKLYYFDTKEGPYEMGYQNSGKFNKKFGPNFFDIADKSAMELFMLNKK
jgi:predicted ATPase